MTTHIYIVEKGYGLDCTDEEKLWNDIALGIVIPTAVWMNEDLTDDADFFDINTRQQATSIVPEKRMKYTIKETLYFLHQLESLKEKEYELFELDHEGYFVGSSYADGILQPFTMSLHYPDTIRLATDDLPAHRNLYCNYKYPSQYSDGLIRVQPSFSVLNQEPLRDVELVYLNKVLYVRILTDKKSMINPVQCAVAGLVNMFETLDGVDYESVRFFQRGYTPFIGNGVVLKDPTEQTGQNRYRALNTISPTWLLCVADNEATRVSLDSADLLYSDESGVTLTQDENVTEVTVPPTYEIYSDDNSIVIG